MPTSLPYQVLGFQGRDSPSHLFHGSQPVLGLMCGVNGLTLFSSFVEALALKLW